MSTKYNLQDPWGLKQLEGDFSLVKAADWQAAIDYVELEDNWKRFDKSILYTALYNAGGSKRVSAKQMQYALSVRSAICSEIEKNNENEVLEHQLKTKTFNAELKHFTLRVAWHDSGWNGSVCKDPQANRYCSGYYSLLSERIRRGKEENIQNEIDYAGRPISEIPYLPPCFWSINLNGSNATNINHINNAAPELKPIPDKLNPNSMFSWPFAISFNRTKKATKAYGSYPPNLDNVRIPLFRDKIKEKKSIAFLYAKYSNPFTEEDRQYLVVGAALVDSSGDLQEFGPKEAIEKRRTKNEKSKNFPTVNWALQYKFSSTSKIIMPYHEYLEKAKELDDQSERERLMDKIKVAVFEPELNHCFKYVAMDIDNDEAIYILSKMRQRLLECKNDGIVDPGVISSKLAQIDHLTGHCWHNRGYFPGFIKLSNQLLQRESTLANFILDIESREEPDEQLLIAINDPRSDPNIKKFKNDLLELKEQLELRGISVNQFLTLCMLDLTEYQFRRVLEGKIREFDKYSYEVPFKNKTPLAQCCDNPYLLVEEYQANSSLVDENTGEDLDRPIELFKIDIAYFPDGRYKSRLDFQRQIIIADQRRLRCLIINHLKSLEYKGDCFEEASVLEDSLRKYPLFYQQGAEFVLPSDLLKTFNPSREKFFEENELKLKIVAANDTRYYYQAKIYLAEKKIEECLHELYSAPKNRLTYRNLDDYVNNSVGIIKKENSGFQESEFKEERIQLYNNALIQKFTVITGGPGSGKSHELLNLIRELQEQGENYLLLAPTGKAALRLKSDPRVKGIEALTIDKWLSDVNNGTFTKERISKVNNLVIDEMSMVDLLKFVEILERFSFSNPAFRRLILVGDPNQLPPIGYGKVLKDIIYYLRSRAVWKNNFIELSGNLRTTASGSGLYDLCRAFEENGHLSPQIEKVINGDYSQIKDEELRVVLWEGESDLQLKMSEEFEHLTNSLSIEGTKEERLNQILGLNKTGDLIPGQTPTLDRFQILSPYLSGVGGSDSINDFYQHNIRDNGRLTLGKGLYKEADKIIRTRNYYVDHELIVSNGSIGVIKGVGNERLYFQEKEYQELFFNDLRKSEKEFFELAYSISIHKAQGSGYDHLFIVLPMRTALLSRELIYTALTRCKKTITIFIQRSAPAKKHWNLLDFARSRTFTDSRKTSLLLSEPFRWYSLEPEEGVFVQSRTELMIYHALARKRNELGSGNFDFYYEKYPTNAVGNEIRIKTDFTVISKGKLTYWEHLGRLGNRDYERSWYNVKLPTYKAHELYENLMTSDELQGISTKKIDTIVEDLASGELRNEDLKNKYSSIHYSLR